MGSPWGRTAGWVAGAGSGPGLRVTEVEGSNVPGSVWLVAVVVCGGWMTGRLEMGMLTSVWAGSCWLAASVVVAAVGGRGARVVMGGGSWFGSGFGLGRGHLGCRRCFCGVGGCVGWCWWWCCRGWCCRLGSGSGLGSNIEFGSGSRLRGTSFRRCEGTGAGWGGFPVCRQGALVACVGVAGPPVAWREAAPLTLAVALWMRSAGRGGWEAEVEDVDEDEDEEEVVVLGDEGPTVRRAVAGFWAAPSAAATAGRMEGMSSGRRLGVAGWGAAAVTWQPGRPIWSASVGEGGAGLWSLLGSGLAGPGFCNA